MSDHKGKGRALSEDENPRNNNEASPSSMLSRVTASANGLTRSVFAAPTGNELDAQGVSILSSAGKGQPSGNSSSLTEQAQQAYTSTPSAHQSRKDRAGGHIRSGESEVHAQRTENEFSSFLDSINSFTPSDDFGQVSHDEAVFNRVWQAGQDQSDQSWQKVWANGQDNDQSQLRVPGFTGPASSITEQESRDGQDVLDLLSKPIMDEELEEPILEDVNWNLTPGQISQLRAMTKDLFPATKPHGQINPDHPLNLVPDFGASNIIRIPQSEQMTEDSYMYMGVNRETYREQWEDVLTRYADEVWGDLLPLVKEAQKEVHEMGSDEQIGKQPKALRRLGAILGHLNARR